MDVITRSALCTAAFEHSMRAVEKLCSEDELPEGVSLVLLAPDSDLATLNLWLAADMPEDHEDCDDLEVAWSDVLSRVTGDGDYPL